MRNTDPNTRYACVALLLRGGAKGGQVSRALIHEICSSQECNIQLVRLLVTSGARIDYSEGQAIKQATSIPMNNGILQCLWEGNGAPTILASLIPLAMNHAQETRLQMLHMLLEKGWQGPRIHVALSDAVNQGPSAQPTIDMLLRYNASVDYRNGEALKSAAGAGHLSILASLLQKNPNSEYRTEALSLAMQTQAVPSITDEPVRFSSVRLLTRAGVSKSEINRALLQAVLENPGTDPGQFKDTLSIFAEKQPYLTKRTNDKSLVILALDNDSPFAMTTALLKTFPFIRENLDADFNIFRKQGGVCYSLTMYVRHYKCRRPISFDKERQCCNLDTCPAPALERLLREHGCHDRYWVETSGANQPEGVCGPPAHIVEEQKRVESLRMAQEKQARIRAEERARQDAIQADLDRAEEAERRRGRMRLAVIEGKRQADANEERRRLAVLEERRQADANEERRRLDMLEATRQADARDERRRLAAVQAEQNAENDRKRREILEQQNRTRLATAKEENHTKRKNDLEAAAMERKARIATVRRTRAVSRTKPNSTNFFSNFDFQSLNFVNFEEYVLRGIFHEGFWEGF